MKMRRLGVTHFILKEQYQLIWPKNTGSCSNPKFFHTYAYCRRFVAFQPVQVFAISKRGYQAFAGGADWCSDGQNALREISNQCPLCIKAGAGRKSFQGVLEVKNLQDIPINKRAGSLDIINPSGYEN